MNGASFSDAEVFISLNPCAQYNNFCHIVKLKKV
jgi:hypothetical protein